MQDDIKYININSWTPKNNQIMYFLLSIYANVPIYQEKITYLNKYVGSKMLRTKYLYRDVNYKILRYNQYIQILQCNFSIAYTKDKKKIFATIFNSLLDILKLYSKQHQDQKYLKKIDNFYMSDKIYTESKKINTSSYFNKQLINTYPKKFNKSIYLYDECQKDENAIFISNHVLSQIFSSGIYDLWYSFDDKEFLEKNFVDDVDNIIKSFQQKIVKILEQ